MSSKLPDRFPSVPYDFYVNDYSGTEIDEEDFGTLARRASDYVRGMTKGLCDKVRPRHFNAVRLAVCAVAEVIQDEQRMTAKSFSPEREIASETVSKHTVSYRASGGVSAADVSYLKDRKLDALRLYLSEVPELKSLFKVRSEPCIHRIR